MQFSTRMFSTISHISLFLFLLMKPLEFEAAICELNMNANLEQWYNSLEYNEKNKFIFSEDFKKCVREMDWYGDNEKDPSANENFPDREEILDLVERNPAKAIYILLGCAGQGEALSINHYNVLYQCLGQQRDNTKCCVSEVHKAVRSSLTRQKKSEQEIERMLSYYIPVKSQVPMVPLPAFDCHQSLAQVFKHQGRDINVSPEELLKRKSETMKWYGQRMFWKLEECLKLCNAEFPINQWRYFPVMRSGVCVYLYQPISFCLVPYGVLKARTNMPVDFTGDEVP